MRSAFLDVCPSPRGPAHLVTVDGGIHEITRVYFFDGHFELGSGKDRIGPCRVVRAELSVNGARLVMHDGRRVDIGAGVIRSLTSTAA